MRMVIGGRRVVEEHHDAKYFVRTGSTRLLVTDAQQQFAEWCANVDGTGDNDGSNEQHASRAILARL